MTPHSPSAAGTATPSDGAVEAARVALGVTSDIAKVRRIAARNDEQGAAARGMLAEIGAVALAMDAFASRAEAENAKLRLAAGALVEAQDRYDRAQGPARMGFPEAATKAVHDRSEALAALRVALLRVDAAGEGG